MSFSYKPLWKLLIDRDMSKRELMIATGISKSTMDKMGRGEQVSMDIVAYLCVQFVPRSAEYQFNSCGIVIRGIYLGAAIPFFTVMFDIFGGFGVIGNNQLLHVVFLFIRAEGLIPAVLGNALRRGC